MVIQGQSGQVLDFFKAVEQRLPVDMQGPGGLTGIIIAPDECGKRLYQVEAGVASMAPKRKQ